MPAFATRPGGNLGYLHSRHFAPSNGWRLGLFLDSHSLITRRKFKTASALPIWQLQHTQVSDRPPCRPASFGTISCPFFSVLFFNPHVPLVRPDTKLPENRTRGSHRTMPSTWRCTTLAATILEVSRWRIAPEQNPGRFGTKQLRRMTRFQGLVGVLLA